MQYFVVMIDYGRRGREAIVDPEITRREVISRVASGKYSAISFIHEIADGSVEDITAEILADAAVPEIPMADADPQANPSTTIAISGSTNRLDRSDPAPHGTRLYQKTHVTTKSHAAGLCDRSSSVRKS